MEHEIINEKQNKIKTLLTSDDFILSGGVYKSPEINCLGESGVVEITTSGIVTIEKSISGKVFTKIESFSLDLSIDGSGVFNLTGMVLGQLFRICSTLEVTSAIILA
jgi:hypothetical protein